jgi:hypothetical protein
MKVDYFTLESYLPYFDRPRFELREIPYVTDRRLRGSEFWGRVQPYLADPANGVIVDSDAFYPRYLSVESQVSAPDRAGLYSILFSGRGSPFRVAARFVSHGPWWLDPRPELVAPEIVVFATQAAIPDTRAMHPLPSPRADVAALGGR